MAVHLGERDKPGQLRQQPPNRAHRVNAKAFDYIQLPKGHKVAKYKNARK